MHTDYLFGVGGANIEDLYDAVQRAETSITGIVAKHEFGAATMADGYARATNRLGVVAATSGGGALNLIAALGESFDSRVPLLALVGQPPILLEGRGAFQDTSGGPGRLDAERVFGAVSKYCVKLTRAEDVDAVLDQAVTAALSGGPAVVLLPKDVQQSSVPVSVPAVADVVEAAHPGVVASSRLADAADLVSAGRGPVVIIAGPEVARQDARAELKVFADAVDAAVVVTPGAKDAFPNRHPRFAGVTGVMGHPHVPDLIGGARLCVLAGASMSMTDRVGLDDALTSCSRVLHIGVEPPFVRAHARLSGALGRTLLDLAALTAGVVEPQLMQRKDLHKLIVPPAAGPGVRYRDAVTVLAAHLERGADVIADAGNTGAAVVHHLPIPDNGRFLIALGMGGMGYAFGAGIGSALGRGRRTFVIAGDGAYFMHGHEVHTAVEYQVPVTFVVFNNNAHAMCVTREQLFYSGDYTFNRFGQAHIGAAVAAMFPHLPAYSTATVDEFDTALDDSRDASGPVFIELICDPDEIPPFTTFLKELSA